MKDRDKILVGSTLGFIVQLEAPSPKLISTTMVNEEQQEPQGVGSSNNNKNLAQIENIKVAVRLRPFTEKEKQRSSKRIVDIEQNTVALYSPKYGAQDEPKKFTFDYSYWSHDGFRRRQDDGVNVPDLMHQNGVKYVGQERVFQDLGMFLLDNALEGYNSALLAYGQTGSGKSYTVSGYGTNEGILPRFARQLFTQLNERCLETSSDNNNNETKNDEERNDGEAKDAKVNDKKKSRYEVYFSMIEIYNEVVRDLLVKNHLKQQQQQQQTSAIGHNNNNNSSISRRGLKVREHPKRGFFVEDLTSIKCANKEEIEQLIDEGQLNKSIVATSMNETSSRGHTIYEFRIRQYKLYDEAALETSREQEQPTDDANKPPTSGGNRKNETITSSVVQLVDLAGSERMAVHSSGSPMIDLAPPSSSRSSSPFGGGISQNNDSTEPLQAAAASSNARGSSSTIRRSTAAPKQRARGTTGGGIVPSSASSNGSASAASRQQQARQLLAHHKNNQQHHHQRFKESVSINQSLSALGNCIQVLSQYSQQTNPSPPSSSSSPSTTAISNSSNSQPKPPKIPYRDSVLTKLLNRCCLGGNSKVVIIATLSPAETNYDDTLSTLRFADRAKQIRTHAVVNRMDTSQVQQQRKAELVGALQRENERLKQLIDGRTTTTIRSDDSSQTSNFDDTENMMDNFNGPSAASDNNNNNNTRAKRSSEHDGKSFATPTRGRTTVRKRQPATSDATSTMARSRSRQPATSRAGNKTRLTGSTSNPALTTSAFANESPLKGLVSPATSKLKSATGAETNISSLSDDEAEDDYDDDDQATLGGSDRALKKARELANIGGESNHASNPSLLNQILPEDSQELADLLDDLDLSDLANIDEGLLSPDSDDSLAALAEEGLSNEEKVNLLNKLLSNSNVAQKIRRQYEKQQARLQRPRRAGSNRSRSARDKYESQRATMLAASNSNLKKTNPYLSNLNQDEQLTGVITLIIKEGETIIGKNQDCGFMLFGPELRGRHARLTRTDKAAQDGKKIAEIFIEPLMESTEAQTCKRVALMVNGQPVTEKLRLNHCDRILFGSGSYFVFIDNNALTDTGNSLDKDQITYDMAHNEVLRKVMNDAENEAVIKEINDYTHRPSTGKQRSTQAQDGTEDHKKKINEQSPKKLSLTRTTTIQNQKGNELSRVSGENNGQLEHLSNINEEGGSSALDSGPGDQDGELFKDRLMQDTYEFALPVTEANAIAKEMSIKVNYGLKILTGEELFPENYHQSGVPTDQYYIYYSDSLNGGSDSMSGRSSGSNVLEERGTTSTNGAEADEILELSLASKFKTAITRSVRPETLDIPPELFVHIYLEEFDLDFYWSKEKFQERRVNMLELYGAWDVGGKPGLVEYLIEQSKYQGYYMIDPFIDDPLTSFVLIGHTQVTLKPLCHMSDMEQDFDILNIQDEIVGSLKIQAIPCHPNENPSDTMEPFKALTEKEISKSFTRDPQQLMNKKAVFLLRIVSCSNVPERFCRVFCQYSLDRDKPLIRTSVQRDTHSDVEGVAKSATSHVSSTQQQAKKQPSGEQDLVQFNHNNFIVFDEVTQELLDFLEHGFLTIQLIGQYKLDITQQQKQSSRTNSSSANSSSSNHFTMSSPTLVSTIINSINKYKYRIEQQGALGAGGNLNNGLLDNLDSPYAVSLTDSAKSHSRITSSMMKSSSDAPSISSNSITINLYDQQNEEDDGTMNGLSQENIIDMILTKRKLDRAENQLHYLKRTINIAEHYNKKNIPVKTVKKLLNSYGHELESGGLEELANDNTVEGKSSSSKHSNCLIM